jgi:integrase
MAWLEKRNGKYRVAYRVGRRVRRTVAYTDKAASQAMLVRLNKALAQGEEGLTDPFADHRNRSISEHLADWIAEIRQTGCTQYYSEQCDGRISRLIRECGWKFLADITTDSFIAWRQTAKSEIAHNRKDKSKAQPVAMGSRTQNHYLVTLISFCRWCVRRGRLATNPLTDAAKVDQAGDVRRGRRALAEDEVTALLAAVPTEYKLLYRFFLATGLRRAEAAQLQWGDVHIDSTTPYIQLRAETTKAKRADALPLRSDLAEELCRARGNAGEEQLVFLRVPRIKEHRRWLSAAGIAYTDATGRRVDIHALRHTFGTLLSKVGVSPREAMSLMRHTDIRLTMNVYTDPRIFNLAAAVEKLPGTGPDTPQAQTQAATGTDASRPLPGPGLGTGEKRVANRVATTAPHGRCSASIGTDEGSKKPQDLSGKMRNVQSKSRIDITAGEGDRTLDMHVGNVPLYH